MPDICMCTGGRLAKCEDCYRRTAKPNEWRQSYFAEPPVKDGECGYYWPMHWPTEETEARE